MHLHLSAGRDDGETLRAANRRNGASPKTVLTGTSKVRLDIPRDRVGTCDPQLIARRQRRFPDFDETIVSMDARAMSTRAIRDHLEELHGIDVSPDLISAVTDAALEEVGAWRGRPLDASHPLVFLDAIRVKIRAEGFVRNKAAQIALGVLPDGAREVPGLWIEQTDGAKVWPRVMNALKTRGVSDILIAVADGLKGFPEAISAVFPDTVAQTFDRTRSTVHPVRHSLDFISWKDRKAVVPAPRAICRAAAVAVADLVSKRWFRVAVCFGIMKRLFGRHRARYFGLAKTHAQLEMAAIGRNLLKVANKITLTPQTPAIA